MEPFGARVRPVPAYPLVGAEHADGFDRVGDELRVFIRDEFFGQRVPEAHVDGAFHLALEQDRVHHLADIMRGYDFLQSAVVVEDHDLRGKSVGDVCLDVRAGVAWIERVIVQFSDVDLILVATAREKQAAGSGRWQQQPF